MIEKIKAFSKAHPREGSIKACKNLRREGIVVNHKKVERIWRENNLGVVIKRRQRRRGKGLERPIRLLLPNPLWGRMCILSMTSFIIIVGLVMCRLGMKKD